MNMNKEQYETFSARLKTASEIEPYLYAPLLDMRLLSAIVHSYGELMEMARESRAILPQHTDQDTLVEVVPIPNPEGVPIWLVHELDGEDRWALKVGVLPRDENLWNAIDVLSETAANLSRQN